MNKIVVPLDGSPLAERILVQVHRLLARTDAQVTLLSVVPEDAVTRLGPAALEAARRHLEPLCESLIANGAIAHARVVAGEAAARIVEVAGEIDASLIAMSTHGRTGILRLARGSVAERVVRAATVPVFLANPLALPDHQPIRMKRILVPLDGSERSAAILPLAADFAKLFEAELVLLHSIETVAVADPAVMIQSTISREEATVILERFLPRLQGLPVRLRVGFGSAPMNILDAAKDESVDLIAISTHGRSGVARWAFGSVAEHVLRHATCPLLVQRTVVARVSEEKTAGTATGSPLR